VFLIETASAPPAGRYTTLSHRWGSEEQVKLTKDTYLQLSNGVKLDSLPQLIQDAIFVTVELGVGYLWIDLLCIYQDDIADWQRESSLMQKVYSNCFCNISAGNANGCFESMFNSRDRTVLLPQVIELETRDQPVGNDDINLDSTKRLYRVLEASFWRNNVTNELVNTRAWVFQERFLSPRVLQFGKRLVTWDCLERPAADIFSDGFPGFLREQHLFRHYNGDFKSWSLVESGMGSERHHLEPYVRWENLVGRYSTCALTFPSDKLVAFGGVAKHMAGILKDEYVAGMWRRYLEGELLWMVDRRSLPGEQPKPRPVEYRAPSWSWASVDGPVRPGTAVIDVESLLIKVEEVHLSYRTGDTTGQVTGGWLRLRGILKELKLVRRPSGILDGWWDMYLDGVKVAILSDDFTLGGLRLDEFGGDFDEEYGNALLFAMCAHKTQRSDGMIDRQMFILLFRLVNREQAVFERIGVLETFDEEVETEVLKTQRPADAPPIPCLEFRDGMHTICVI
jgi:hypothetical protein